jgi:hypothetical protein
MVISLMSGVKSRLLPVMKRSAPMLIAVARWVASAAFSPYLLDRAVASSAVALSTGRRSSLASSPASTRISSVLPSRSTLPSTSGTSRTDPIPAVGPADRNSSASR